MVVRCAYFISRQADDMHYFEQGKLKSYLSENLTNSTRASSRILRILGKILLTLTKDIFKFLIKSLKILKKNEESSLQDHSRDYLKIFERSSYNPQGS